MTATASAAGGGRRRLGRTLRRTRGGGNGDNTAAPLQAIEENTVIDLTQPSNSTSSHFGKSPPPLVKPKRAPPAEITKPEKSEKQEKLDEPTRGNKRKREQSLAVTQTTTDVSVNTTGRSTRGAKQSTKSQKTSQKTTNSKTKTISSGKAAGGANAAAELDKKTQRAAQLLDELEKQLEKRCVELLAEAERKSEELRMELKVQLMFLPESVRAMPWKTFIEDFGGSLENVIQNVKEQDYIHYVTSQQGLTSPKSALKIRPVPSTVRSKDRRSNGNTPGSLPGAMATASSTSSSLPLGLSTPSAMIRASISNYQTPLCTPSSNIPSTVVRTARKGEMTYSIRGSPIAPGSITKAPVGSLVATFQPNEAEPLASITLDNDTAVDLTNPELLNDETRAQARAKLEALQAKVNALLRQFK